MFLTLDQHLEQAERDYLSELLEETGGNITAAARIAGRNRTGLHKRLAAFGLIVPRVYTKRDRTALAAKAAWAALQGSAGIG